MASLPFVISGILYNTDGSTVVASATVTVRNERTNETKSATTNSSGQYAINLADLTRGWSNGDTITVFTIYTNLEDYEEYVIVESDGSKTINLTLAAVPASGALKYYTVQEWLDFFSLTAGNEGVPLTNQIVKIGVMVEKEIDDLCSSEFSAVTNTSTLEYHDAFDNQVDWFTDFTPMVSVTTFQINSATEDNAASWTTLTEADNQIKVSLDTGRVRITGDIDDSTQSNYPEPGVKQIRITYTYGRSSVPSDIKKLAILMVAKDVMQGAVSRALFRGQDSFKTDHYNVFNRQIETILSRYRNYDMYNT